jgi:toxin HigB-1
MIKSFKNKGLKNFFETGSQKGIQPKHSSKLARILDRLDASTEVNDMKLPGYRLHPWKGSISLWLVDVSGNWRVVFKFEENHAYVVDYLDPH